MENRRLKIHLLIRLKYSLQWKGLFNPQSENEKTNTVSVNACQLPTDEKYCLREGQKAAKNYQYLLRTATNIKKKMFNAFYKIQKGVTFRNAFFYV